MCGIFGTFNAERAAEQTLMGLHGIQHRAVDFAGIATGDGTYIHLHTGADVARRVFANPDTLNKLHGRHALGHIRYGTSKKTADDKFRDNTQPIKGWYNNQEFALAHNGNLNNLVELQQLLGKPLMTTMDTEYIVRLLQKWQTGDLAADLKRVTSVLRGSYTMCLLFPDRLVAVQDPSNCHPLCLGKRDDSYFISSESCTFGGIDADFVRDIEPGEILCISSDGLQSHTYATPRRKQCRFELNYYSLPTSQTFGKPVDEYRIELGKLLERHCPAEGADIVTSVPDSANFIAVGYGENKRSGISRQVIIRNHYVGRSFIQESQAKRDTAVANKFSFSAHAIKGKKIVVVDDSIVRGTTLLKIVAKLRRYGAKEIHLRSASPPIKNPCLYGIDTPSHEELLCSGDINPEHVAYALGADSLMFLPLEVQKAMSPNPGNFCHACMDGNYWH